MAQHIAEGYEKKGASHDKAEERAWRTVNKETGGAANPVLDAASVRKFLQG